MKGRRAAARCAPETRKPPALGLRSIAEGLMRKSDCPFFSFPSARRALVPEIAGIARTPRTSVRSSSGSPRDPAPGPFAASSSSGGRQAAGTILVFDDLRDGAHRALLDAVAASDARLLVHDLGSAADHFQDLLRASVDADAATDALISFDNRRGHDRSPSRLTNPPRMRRGPP